MRRNIEIMDILIQIRSVPKLSWSWSRNIYNPIRWIVVMNNVSIWNLYCSCCLEKGSVSCWMSVIFFWDIFLMGFCWVWIIYLGIYYWHNWMKCTQAAQGLVYWSIWIRTFPFSHEWDCLHILTKYLKQNTFLKEMSNEFANVTTWQLTF